MGATGARPDCLIIGAPKAGTTSLFTVVASHPEICPSAEKEAKFFSNDERFERGLDWYRDRYFRHAPAGAVRLEASPTYLTWSEKVAPRIRQSFPADGVRLVAILRDPVKRAYSHYWHRVRLGHEPLPFAEAIDREDERLRAHWPELLRTGDGRYGYLRASAYASRLRPFLDTFGRERMWFLLQEDLRPERFPEAMKHLLRFLGIDDTVALEPARLNVPTAAVHQTVARTYWRIKRTALKPAYTTLVPARVRSAILGALFRPATYPPLDTALERRLRERLADEIRQCQSMIGRDLSHWLPR